MSTSLSLVTLIRNPCLGNDNCFNSSTLLPSAIPSATWLFVNAKADNKDLADFEGVRCLRLGLSSSDSSDELSTESWSGRVPANSFVLLFVISSTFSSI